jgi:hypothetical protein
MTIAQKLKRIYMLLRWYDRYAEYSFERKDEVPEEDLRLALELEKEMHALQAEALRAKKKKSRTVQAKRPKTKPKLK